MSIAGVFGVLAALLLGAAWWQARRAARGDWVREAATRLVITPAPRGNQPQATLERGQAVLFGPVPVLWQSAPSMAVALGNPARLPELPGGDAPAGEYRVLAAADLSAAAPPLREAFGDTALILQPEQGGRPLLLHARRRSDSGSQGGIGISAEPLRVLLGQLGDPRGLRVSIRRRNIRRNGWGGMQQKG